jgi:hypothetical protein
MYVAFWTYLSLSISNDGGRVGDGGALVLNHRVHGFSNEHMHGI